MATKLKSVDVVTVGVGLTGTILAKELADTGLKVVGLERGRWRDTDPDFSMPGAHDELKYVRRHELMQDLSKETLTFRNATSETALPMRQLGSFLPGEGVGGAAVHWGGLTWRFLPWDFETKSQTLARYGAKHVSEECTLQDWGVTYEELEPHFNRFEYLYGVSGKAGNLQGKIIPGGNPFEGSRSKEYPNPPLKTAYSSTLFKQAVEKMGYKPFPVPTAANSRAYKNGRPQLRLPDALLRDALLRGQELQLFHGRGWPGRGDRRVQRRQLRPLWPRFHRRRILAGRLERRASHRNPPGAARHAALGR